MESEFPGNRRSPAPEPAKKKNIERIVETTVVRRKQPIGKRFANLFVAGDSHSVGQYVFFDVLLPALKDTLVDAVSQGVERMIFGEVRPTTRRSGFSNVGHIAYNRFAQNRVGGPPRDNNPVGRPGISRQARATHNFDDILLNTRHEGEEVLATMHDMLTRYETISVSDLYEMVGETPNFTDEKWGWVDLTGASVSRTRDGYLLNLPRPEPLD